MEMHIVKWFTLRCLCGLLLLFVDVVFLFVCLFFAYMRVVGFLWVFFCFCLCLCLTPNSRSAFHAGVSLNIHSFICLCLFICVGFL